MGEGRKDLGTAIAELGKRRGFFFPSFEAYGGVAGFYTYGPRGTALKRNLESLWRERFTNRENNFEIEGPTVTPKPVLDASGHTDIFDDLLIECGDCGATHRADHLIEDATEIEDAEGFEIEEVESLIREHDLRCPRCGADLAGEPVDSFNLMFETAIGPGNGDRAFLRPETAQSIFVEFPRLADYARGELPFGVTQIGTGYRNEISPRRGLIRVREFTMAELELFIDPVRNEPDLEPVTDVQLRLYPIEQQESADQEYRTLTVDEAVDAGVIGNAWIGYYLGRAVQWYDRVGIDLDRLRFRQHRPPERSHYATDCWDAEAEIDGEWIEIAGFAHRGCYDLEKHAEYSDEDYTIFIPYDEPVEREQATVDPDMGYLGPEFGSMAPAVAEALEELAAEDPTAFEEDDVPISVDDETVTVPVEKTGFQIETVTETGEHVRPQVIEPSFGVGRTVYSILAHNFHRDVVEDEERTVLRFPPAVAPITVAVFPLMARDGLDARAETIAEALREEGFAVTYDDTGNIGRRYRRQDEIGTPYCVTVDYETLDDDTVTVRDRDTTAQERVPVADLSDRIDALVAGDEIVTEG